MPNTVSDAAKGDTNFILMKSLGVTFRQMQKDTEQFFSYGAVYFCTG